MFATTTHDSKVSTTPRERRGEERERGEERREREVKIDIKAKINTTNTYKVVHVNSKFTEAGSERIIHKLLVRSGALKGQFIFVLHTHTHTHTHTHK